MVESDLGHVAAVATEVEAGSILHHCWVAEDLDLSVVVARCDQLESVVKRAVGPVAVIDVRAILLWLPDTLHGPAEDAALSCPLLIPRVGGSTGVLDSPWN